MAAGDGRGSLYAYPAGARRPKVPVLTYGRGATTVQTSVPVGRGGAIVVENSGSKSRSVAVDLAGAYEPAALDGRPQLRAPRPPRSGRRHRLRSCSWRTWATAPPRTSRCQDVVRRGTDSVLLQVTAKRAKNAGTLDLLASGSGAARTPSTSRSRTGQTVTGTVVAGVSDGARSASATSARGAWRSASRCSGSFR